MACGDYSPLAAGVPPPALRMAARNNGLYIALLVGSMSGETKPVAVRSTLRRRDFLRRTAVAGTSAFVVPTIVTVDPAVAQALTSPPPEPPGRRPPAGQPTGPVGLGPSHEGAGGTRQRVPVTERTELPRTGADIDRLVAAGLAATAGGAALVLWSADVQSKAASPRPDDPEPET